MQLTEFMNLNREKGFHWFSDDTMKFFASSIPEWCEDSGLFVSKESGPFGAKPYKFTVRKADFDTGKVSTVSKFQEFSSAASAIKFMQKCNERKQYA